MCVYLKWPLQCYSVSYVYLWVWPNSPGCSPRAAVVRLGVHQHSRGRGRRVEAGRSPLSCWWQSMNAGLRWREEEEEVLLPIPSLLPSNHPEATSHSPPRSLLCWSWWILWRSVSGGLDFLTKPFGPRAATAALGQCARPKLTQPTLLQNLTKKKKPNGVSLSICHLWEWSKSITPYQILLFDHILNPLSFSTLKQMEYDNVNEVFDPTEHSSLFSCGQDRWRLLYIL